MSKKKDKTEKEYRYEISGDEAARLAFETGLHNRAMLRVILGTQVEILTKLTEKTSEQITEDIEKRVRKAREEEFEWRSENFPYVEPTGTEIEQRIKELENVLDALKGKI